MTNVIYYAALCEHNYRLFMIAASRQWQDRQIGRDRDQDPTLGFETEAEALKNVPRGCSRRGSAWKYHMWGRCFIDTGVGEDTDTDKLSKVSKQFLTF